MKKLNTIILLLFYCGMAVTYAELKDVSQEDALAIAQRQFIGQDVDYFLYEREIDGRAGWQIFVDAEPMKGWKHDCYMVYIPMETFDIDAYNPTVHYMDIPPIGKYTPLSVKNRYGNKANSKPLVSKSANNRTEDLESARRTYAIIISGGVNAVYNYERYWNDCSFIYQTLVNKYSIPKDNIYPIMSDGTDPNEDMRCTTGGIISQPLDLDNDGVADIKLAATKSNVVNTLSQLSRKLQKDDHLFIYVIDHGGTDDNKTNSYICLWNNETLYDYELANMLTPFSEKFVNINVVLGQCFSSGFNDNLTKIGCVVSSASTGSESSWSCPDIPYDEFVYHWTSAMNNATHDGITVNSDSDGNGRITVKEAFEYAKQNDRITAEHPQYTSTPVSVGEDLAFNHIVPSIDLYIKDNDLDFGQEPNLTTDQFWGSTSICVRNSPDSIFKHENPYFTTDHLISYIYLRVYNRGKEDYFGGKFALIYWALASTGLTDKAWKGRELYDGKYPTGGDLEAIHIDTIYAGSYRDVEIPWMLPQLMVANPGKKLHFCLLAKIMDTAYDDGYVDGTVYFDLPGSNNQAQKNVSIISKEELPDGINVFVRNTIQDNESYSLELVPREIEDILLFSQANMEMEMSPTIYNAWERGGFKAEDIELPTGTTNGAEARTVKFVSPNSKLKAICLNKDEYDVVKIKFNFSIAKTAFERSDYTLTPKYYTYDLIQKDEDGNIIGGETFIVEPPLLLLKPIEIIPTNEGDSIMLKTDLSEYKTIEWFKENGESLGHANTITIMPRYNDDNFAVVALSEDGEIATGKISLETSYGIKNVSTISIPNTIIVNLKADAPNNAEIRVTSAVEGTLKSTTQIPSGTNYISVNSSNLSDGIYILSYLVNGINIDQRKITIQ